MPDPSLRNPAPEEAPAAGTVTRQEVDALRAMLGLDAPSAPDAPQADADAGDEHADSRR